MPCRTRRFVDYKAAAVAIHFADTSKWANFGSKWVLEKNAPRDTSRMHPRWWTPQVRALKQVPYQ